ncbi:MAG: GNAT family N-acetyltransferase [Rhodospirillaceae bacterium]|nr:GNAT family N-acetyltransferase [Rhodospirillaceae bacterium]
MPVSIMPTPPITLRAATSADHGALRAFDARLIAEASLPGATRDDFIRFQRNFTDKALADINPDSRLIVACDAAGVVCGYIHLQPIHDEVLDQAIGYVSIIAVSENAGGQGIGRKLMQAAEDWAREMNYPAIVLDVFASNETARRFYEKAGYGEDSLRLRKEIERPTLGVLPSVRID